MQEQPIQWHPGFFAGMELELRAYHLDFQTEYQLTRGPLSIDLLIIRKLNDEKIDNEIGEVFRRHNIVEYKSPGDALNIDVFYKAQAYAALYKASGEHVDEIPAGEITVSLFRDVHPAEMMDQLAKQGARIEKRHPGIYQIEGIGLFPTQVVVTGELQSDTHAVLRVLSNRAERKDVETFLRVSAAMKNPGDAARIDAVLQVSASANRELYETLYREGSEMCKALQDIMEPDFKKAEARGEARGRLNGIYETLAGLVKDQLITEQEAARRAGVSEAEFRKNAGLTAV